MIVWVTGASSGLGMYIARALVRRGHTVIGGARSFRAGTGADGVHCLPLDVTSDESVAEFVRGALALYPRVDAVINAAGILMLGSCEETSPQEYMRVLDTDLVGMVRVNSAVLPLMRKQGGGRIMLLSSINGLLGIPYQSAYTAAKHAVEGYAECLALEAYRDHVGVCLIEPGDHRGGSDRCRLHAKAMSDASPHADDFRSAVATIHRDESHGSDPEKLGEKVARALEKRRMPFRIRIASPDQHAAVYLHALLPARAFAAFLRFYYLGRRKES